MKDGIEHYPNKDVQVPNKIARWLFYINLLPSIIGIVMVVVMLIFISVGHFTYMNLFRTILLIAGVFCEWVYFKIFRSVGNPRQKKSWTYSIVLNVLFISYYILDPFTKESLGWPLIMAVCPLLFLIASCYALQRCTLIVRGNQ